MNQSGHSSAGAIYQVVAAPVCATSQQLEHVVDYGRISRLFWSCAPLNGIEASSDGTTSMPRGRGGGTTARQYLNERAI